MMYCTTVPDQEWSLHMGVCGRTMPGNFEEGVMKAFDPTNAKTLVKRTLLAAV